MKFWYRAALATYYVRRAVEWFIPLEHPVSATMSKRWGYLTSRYDGMTSSNGGPIVTVTVTLRTWHPGWWWLAAGWLIDGDNDGGSPAFDELARRAAVTEAA